jgi:hypothetical protein
MASSLIASLKPRLCLCFHLVEGEIFIRNTQQYREERPRSEDFMAHRKSGEQYEVSDIDLSFRNANELLL